MAGHSTTPLQNRYLSESELSAFGRDGFLVIKNLYAPEEIRRVSEWIDELAAAADGGKMVVHHEESVIEKGRRLLARIEQFADHHAGLAAFIRDERLVGRGSELLGEPAALFKEKINFKLPGGGGFKPHQDIQPAQWDDYASYFISVVVAVDENTEENGCLELSAGHHTRGWIGRKDRPLTPEELAGIEFQKIPLAPGDAVYFDCFVPHQSAENRSGKPRRNLYLTFNRLSEGDLREKYFLEKRKSSKRRRLLPFVGSEPVSWMTSKPIE